MQEFTRERIIDESEYLKYSDDFKDRKQELLTKFLYDLDIEVVKILLEADCDPNINTQCQYETRNHGFLHDLVYEFHNQYSLKGDLILQLAELLLTNKANPDQPGNCNTAPIQYCTSKISEPFKQLLLKYSAKPEGNTRY